MWSTSLVDNWAISNHQVLFVGRLRSEPSSLDNAPFAICQLSFATEHRQLIEHVASKRCAREEFHDVYHLHGWGWSPAELFHRFSPSNIGANSLALLLRGRHNSQNLLKEGHVETQANGGPTTYKYIDGGQSVAGIFWTSIQARRAWKPILLYVWLCLCVWQKFFVAPSLTTAICY